MVFDQQGSARISVVSDLIDCRLVKILERPAGQQFAPFQRPLEGTVKLGWRLTDWADEKGHAELVVSKNTNELKTGSPERFRLEVSRLG